MLHWLKNFILRKYGKYLILGHALFKLSRLTRLVAVQLLEVYNHMNKTIILALGAAGIALSASIASAASDDQYPAANFQPKVVYLDESVAQKAPAARKVVQDAKYPATYFEPTVVFLDKDLARQAQKPQKQIEFDPKYPATYFQPKVIYP